MSVTLGDVFVFLKGDKTHLDKTIDGAEQKAKSFAGGIASSLNNAFSFALGGFIQQGLNNIALGIQNVGIRAFDAVASNESLRLSLESLAASQIRAADGTISMNDAMTAAVPLAKEMQEWINRVAILSPFGQDTIAKSVQMAQSFKFNSTAAKELIQTLTDSTAATGRSGAAMEQATRAIGQMNLAGVVHKEELNQLSEAGIDYVRVLDQMGVTLGDVTAGTVRADDFIRTLIDTLQGDFAGAAERQATSWAGIKSTFNDIVNIGLRNFFEGILEPLQPLAQKLTDTFSNEAVLSGMRQMGQFIGDLIAPAAEFLAEKLDKLPALIERVSNFIRQLRDELAGLTAGDILAGLEPGLAKMQSDLNTTLDTLAKAHQGTLDQIQADIAAAGEKVGQKMVEIGEKYGPKIAELEERITETAAGFQERLTDMAEAHAKRRAEIEDQITKNTAKLEEKLTELKRDHQRRRQQLVTSLLTAESEEQYLQIQSQIKAEDDKYKEQVDKTKAASVEQKTELEKRLKEEDAAYKKQEARTKRDRDKALADIQEQLSKVSAERAKAEGEVQAAYQAEVDALNNKIAQENAAYEQQQADLKASFAQQMEEFKADTLARAAAIGTGLAAQVAGWVNAFAGGFDRAKTIITDFITNNATPLIGVLIGIGVVLAGGAIIGGLTALAGALAGVSLPILAIIGGLAILYTAWVQNWGDIQGKTQAVLDFLQPYWDRLMLILADFADNILPKLQLAWDTLVLQWQEKIEPALARLLEALGLGQTASMNFETALWLLETVLDAVAAAYTVLSPMIELAGTYLEAQINTLATVVGWFNSLRDAGQSAAKMFRELTDRVVEYGKSLLDIGPKLPDWLTPGSPTPLELGLKGISSAIKSLPDITPKVEMGALRPAFQAVAGPSVTMQQTNYLPAAPAGFDREALLDDIDNRTSGMLAEWVKGLKPS